MNLSELFGQAKEWLTDFLNDIQALIFAMLPDSPFKGLTVPQDVIKMLKYINWLVPFNLIGKTLLAWIGAITIYYAYQTVLRWIKSIQ